MRSLIILEVEHGETTDALESIITAALIEGDGMVKEYTVKIDIPECFRLESNSLPRAGRCTECGGTDNTHFRSCSKES